MRARLPKQCSAVSVGAISGTRSRCDRDAGHGEPHLRDDAAQDVPGYLWWLRNPKRAYRPPGESVFMFTGVGTTGCAHFWVLRIIADIRESRLKRANAKGIRRG